MSKPMRKPPPKALTLNHKPRSSVDVRGDRTVVSGGDGGTLRVVDDAPDVEVALGDGGGF